MLGCYVVVLLLLLLSCCWLTCRWSRASLFWFCAQIGKARPGSDTVSSMRAHWHVTGSVTCDILQVLLGGGGVLAVFTLESRAGNNLKHPSTSSWSCPAFFDSFRERYFYSDRAARAEPSEKTLFSMAVSTCEGRKATWHQEPRERGNLHGRCRGR
jgi:hypothetical protein